MRLDADHPNMPSPLSVRLTKSERDLLEAASTNARTTLSDFVRRKALEAAEIDLLDRRIVEIPANKWAEFETWAQTPPKSIPAVKKLAKRKPAWQP